MPMFRFRVPIEVTIEAPSPADAVQRAEQFTDELASALDDSRPNRPAWLVDHEIPVHLDYLGEGSAPDGGSENLPSQGR